MCTLYSDWSHWMVVACDPMSVPIWCDPNRIWIIFLWQNVQCYKFQPDSLYSYYIWLEQRCRCLIYQKLALVHFNRFFFFNIFTKLFTKYFTIKTITMRALKCQNDFSKFENRRNSVRRNHSGEKRPNISNPNMSHIPEKTSSWDSWDIADK